MYDLRPRFARIRGNTPRVQWDVRWDQLRDALRELRLRLTENKSEFSMQAGLNRKTIDRVEGKGSSSYKPDYETINKWLRACGESVRVTDFLKKYEHLSYEIGESASSESDTLPVTQEPQLAAGAPFHESVSVAESTTLPGIDNETAARLLEREAIALFRAVAALRGHKEVRPPDAGESDRSNPNHGVG